MHSTQYALIVAGGKGTRIPGNIPKQFIELNGLPVLMHTVNAFYAYSDDIHIILVLPADDFVAWDALCKLHQFQRPILLQPGGSTRFQSVKLGLSRIEGEGIVAIHDGVRPMVTPEIIKKSFDLAEQNRSAVASVALKESIRRIDSGKTSALDRSHYTLIQTPQTFQVSLIRSAYDIPEDPALTDDASIAERAGHAISLFEGSYDNIKITTVEDLVMARALLKARS